MSRQVEIEFPRLFTEEDIRSAYNSGLRRGGSSYPEDYMTEDEVVEFLIKKKAQS